LICINEGRQCRREIAAVHTALFCGGPQWPTRLLK
jgi:hypothetical protein